MRLELNQALNHEDIRNQLADQGYAHIPSVLPEEQAQSIHTALLERTPWNLVFNENDKHFDLSAEQLQKMSKPDLSRLQKAIFAQAQNGFQYSYHNYPIYDAARAGINKGHVLHGFLDWLNADEFLGFARTATGIDDINFVDAQATRYSAGHFLNTHDDSHESKNRRAAYIFNFTDGWRADWGGFLQLLDDAGHVRRGIAPTFNSLNILTIPQRHNVSFVTPFAGSARLAVSGWLRHDG